MAPAGRASRIPGSSTSLSRQMAFPTLQRKGRYDLYGFERNADGRWTFTRSDAKVFAND